VRISALETASAERWRFAEDGTPSLHGSRHRFQLPVAIGAGISLDGNTSGCRMRLYITRRAFNFDFATGGIRLNSTAGP